MVIGLEQLGSPARLISSHLELAMLRWRVAWLVLHASELTLLKDLVSREQGLCRYVAVVVLVLKCSSMSIPDGTLSLTLAEPHISATAPCRAGLKLEAALDVFGVDVRGVVALDSGLSTGGFTDCLLQRGATRVYGIDVGFGQASPASLVMDAGCMQLSNVVPSTSQDIGVNERKVQSGCCRVRVLGAAMGVMQSHAMCVHPTTHRASCMKVSPCRDRLISAGAPRLSIPRPAVAHGSWSSMRGWWASAGGGEAADG